MISSHARLGLILGLFSTTLFPRVSCGQQAVSAWSRCIDSLPDRDLKRVAAFIGSDADDVAPDFTKPADLLLEIVAGRIRSALGAPPGQLPIGEPTVTRRNLRGSVQITVHRDGAFTGRINPDTSVDSGAGGVRLISRAIEAATAEGEHIFWPERARGDSATFRVFFAVPFPDKEGTPGDLDLRFASVVFTLALPWIEHPAVTKLAEPAYPDVSVHGSSEGFIVLQFRVDENGRVDRSTLKDLWPPDRPPLVGSLAEYYRQFVNAAKSSVLRTQYRPANVSGCIVAETVTQPFDFRLRHQ